jgi:hypothetical protein
MIRYILVLIVGVGAFFACGKKSDSDSSSAEKGNESVGKLALECGGKTCIGTGE